MAIIIAGSHTKTLLLLFTQIQTKTSAYEQSYIQPIFECFYKQEYTKYS